MADVPIYGPIRAMTSEGKSAYASQVWDAALGMFQSEINGTFLDEAYETISVVAQNYTQDGTFPNGSYDISYSGNLFNKLSEISNSGKIPIIEGTLVSHSNAGIWVTMNKLSAEYSFAGFTKGTNEDYTIHVVVPQSGTAKIYTRAAGASYIKPSTGIPKSDLASAVQDSLDEIDGKADKADTYTKEEVNGLITTPNVNYVTVSATSSTTAATDVLPAIGASDTIYRVGNWDGTQYDATVYSEYAWDGTHSQYIKLSTKGTSDEFVTGEKVSEVGIDDEPTAGSDNLVKSGGVVDTFKDLTKGYNLGTVIAEGTSADNYAIIERNLNIPAGILVKNVGTASIRIYNTNSYNDEGVIALLLQPNKSAVLEFVGKMIRAAGTAGTYKILGYVDTFIADIQTNSAKISENTEDLVRVKDALYPYTQITDYPTNIGWITSDGVWDAQRRHASLSVSPDEVYYLRANPAVNYLRYAFVVSDNPVEGEEPDYVEGTTLMSVDANTTVEVTIPSGCNYLVFNVNSDHCQIYERLDILDTFNADIQTNSAKIEELELRTDTSFTDGVSINTNNLVQDIQLTNYPYSNHFGDRLTFSCKVTSFTGLAICQGYETYRARWFEVDNTNVILYGSLDTADGSGNYGRVVKETVSHGLTISRILDINIIITASGHALFVMNTVNGQFTHDFEGWGLNGNGLIQVKNNGSVLTDCTFSAANPFFKSAIWIFGASHEGISSQRWVGQLKNMGYCNYLINAYAGRNGSTLIQDFRRAVNYGKPKYLIASMSNDAVDSTNIANTRTLLNLCNELGITLIIRLSANTPSADFTARNAVLSELDCRKVDYRKALVDPTKTWASGVDTWYDGYLSSDNIHPTTLGARALVMRFLADVPELMQYGRLEEGGGGDSEDAEAKMTIVTSSGTSLTASVDNYYRFDSAVNTLAITLSTPSDTTHITKAVFMFTTGATPAVTFAGATGVNVIAQEGFSIEATTTYEINAIYNGVVWVIAAMQLDTTPINS